jgi:hypothetical protein
MKTLIAALALLSLAAGPVFAASPALQLNRGPANAFVYTPGVHPNLWTTSREGLVEAH